MVLDTRINPDHIEKYADPTAHGGVLEPSGMVEVKFRRPQRCALMERTNEELAALRLKSETGDADATRKFREMQTKSYQVYTVASETLADLHDTAMGMESVGCIRQVIPWNEARLFFQSSQCLPHHTHPRMRRKVKEKRVSKIFNPDFGF